MQEAAHCASQSNINLRDPKLHIAICPLLGQVNVIYSHDFTSAGINDLLIQQILCHGKPALIGFIGPQGALRNVQFDLSQFNRGYLIVPCNQRLKTSARQKGSARLCSAAPQARQKIRAPCQRNSLARHKPLLPLTLSPSLSSFTSPACFQNKKPACRNPRPRARAS